MRNYISVAAKPKSRYGDDETHSTKHFVVTSKHPNYQHLVSQYQQLMRGQMHAPLQFISDTVSGMASTSPQHPALITTSQPHQPMTYAELDHKSQSLAQWLHNQGLQRGDSLALMTGQDSAFYLALASCLRQGYLAVPLPKLLRSDDIIHRIDNLQIKGFLANYRTALPAMSACQRCQYPPKIKLLHQESHTSLSQSQTVAAALNNNSQHWHTWPTLETATLADAQLSPSDPQIALYTSGTTGLPKAAIHMAQKPYMHIFDGLVWMDATPDDIVFNASDTGWGFSVWTTFGAWSAGSTILVDDSGERFNAERMITMLCEHKVTLFAAAPAVLNRLAHAPNFSQLSQSLIKRIIAVGEPLAAATQALFEQQGLEIRLGYGQAETKAVCINIDGVTYFDADLSIDTCPNTEELLLSRQQERGGLSLFHHYHPNFVPDETRHCSNDVIHINHCNANRIDIRGHKQQTDQAQSIHIVGRKDDVFKFNAYRIGPYEIESVIYQNFADIIEKTAVVGSLTTITAYILLATPALKQYNSASQKKQLAQRIQATVKAKTAPYKYPRHIVFLTHEQWASCQTTSGKIKRRALKQQFAVSEQDLVCSY